jgi:hypothetical protein
VHYDGTVFFLASQYVSKQVKVVPSINRPTKVNPSVFCSLKKEPWWWCKTSILCSSKVLHQRRSNSVVPPKHRRKNFYFHFKRYNLTIHAVNFCEFFCTSLPSSLGQDLIVECEKININKFGLLELKMSYLGCFFWEKWPWSYRG